MPEYPFDSAFTLVSIIALTISVVSGSPYPQACERIRFSCRVLQSSFDMLTFENSPNPVVTPYITL